MKLIAQVKLLPSPEQREALALTLKQANAAANYVSVYAWQQRTFRQYDLHRAIYHDVRGRFGLSAQLTVRVIAKVADAYKLDRRQQRVFRPMGAVAYDERILSWNPTKSTISIWTIDGRQTVPFVCSDRQRLLLAVRQGEADLVYREGVFYLYQTCNIEEPPTGTTDEFLGIDLGIVNISTDSDGESMPGQAIEDKRRTFAHRRRNLQRKGTRAARRKLRQIRSKQQRYQTDTNHRISKAIVAKAQDTGRGIALEDLKYIRNRLTVRRRQRARLANWSFFQLDSFIAYKARLAGVPVVFVDPRNTSRTCPACGHADKANRPSQSLFSCTSCRFSAPADVVAARNIAFRARAAVNQPMVATFAG